MRCVSLTASLAFADLLLCGAGHTLRPRDALRKPAADPLSQPTGGKSLSFVCASTAFFFEKVSLLAALQCSRRRGSVEHFQCCVGRSNPKLWIVQADFHFVEFCASRGTCRCGLFLLSELNTAADHLDFKYGSKQLGTPPCRSLHPHTMQQAPIRILSCRYSNVGAPVGLDSCRGERSEKWQNLLLSYSRALRFKYIPL